MPGTTQYLDTPVVPTSAFAARLQQFDCAYPDATPAIAEVDGDGSRTLGERSRQHSDDHGAGRPDGAQLWVLRALGHHGSVQPEDHHAPLWLWRNARHGKCNHRRSQRDRHQLERHVDHGHGAHGRAGLRRAAAGAIRRLSNRVRTSAVRSTGHHGRQRQAVDRHRHRHRRRQGSDPRRRLWHDPGCDRRGRSGRPDHRRPDLQRSDRAVSCRHCNGRRAITGKTTAAHNEMLLMWKPVRLQGVGAASSIINANTHPAGKLDPWRQQVNCLFGLALNGYARVLNQPVRSDRHGHLRQHRRHSMEILQYGRRPTNAAGRPAAARRHRRLGYHGKRQPGPAVARANADGSARRSRNHRPVEGRQLPRDGYLGTGAEAAFPTGTTLLTAM